MSLFELRDQYGTAATARKLREIRRIAELPKRTGAALRSMHDELLYHVAYPSSIPVLRAAERALSKLAQRSKTRRPHVALDNAGMAGTFIKTTFSVDLLRWLCKQNPRSVAIDWDQEEAAAALDRLIPLICSPAEMDGVLSNRRSTREWVQAAAKHHASEMAWLLEPLDSLKMPASWLDDWFESLSLPVRWLPERDSRTFTRFPPRPVFCTPEGLIKRVELSALLEKKLPRPTHLNPQARYELIDTARATLAARARETDPVTYANPRDLALFQLERGIDVLLLGMVPERRLPIESYIGFVAARNRVPIAYGGSWIFGRRCEIGVNLFEEFRGGESAQIFGQVMRTYRQQFHVTQFLVDPFQFGADNEEAIRSGAFWFYYRLGFRSIDRAIRASAEREVERLREIPGSRTSDRLLRRFATAKVFLDAPMGATAAESFAPVSPDLESLGLAVSDWIADQFRGDRAAAEMSATKWLERGVSTHVSRATLATCPRIIALRVMAPLFAMLDSKRRFDAEQWRSIYDVVRAKSAASERQSVRAWQAAIPAFSRQFGSD